MTKEDYDRNAEQLLLDKCNAELEVERLKEELEKLSGELRRYKSIVYLCEKVKDCDKE